MKITVIDFGWAVVLCWGCGSPLALNSWGRASPEAELDTRDWNRHTKRPRDERGFFVGGGCGYFAGAGWGPSAGGGSRSLALSSTLSARWVPPGSTS